MKKLLFTLGLTSLVGATAFAAWTDPTLTAGNPIKAVHITEIRDAIKWTPLDATTGDIYYNGGNVGIGISSPSEALDVSGRIEATSDIKSGVGSGGVAMTINDGYGNANLTFNHARGTPEQNGNAARIEVNTDSTSGASMYFELKDNVSNGVATSLDNVMTLQSNGNVGIGDTTPDYALDVVGDILIDGNRNLRFGTGAQRLYGDNNSAIYADSNSDTVTQMIFRDAQGTAYGRVYGDGNGANFGMLDGDGNWMLRSAKDVEIGFRVNDVEHFKITPVGAVITNRFGINGAYNSGQVQGIWTIGQGYNISVGSNTFGSQYGMGYSYNTVGGGISGWGHQIHFLNAGSRNASISLTGGQIGVSQICDQNGGNCSTPASLAAGSADNLGNHTATTTLNLANNQVRNVGSLGVGKVPGHALDVAGVIRQVRDSNYDIWLQGGASTSGGDARNLAILGVDDDSGDTLYLNYGGEYAGGTIIGGATTFPNGISGAAGVTLSSDWFRVNGNNGIYWNTHGGGWNMQDSTWIRAYGGKSIYTTGNLEVGQDIIARSGSRALHLRSDGTNAYISHGAGFNGNGTTTNGALYINGGSNLYLRTGSGAGTDRVTVGITGNVGIGTTGPTSLLHLNAGGLGNGLTNYLTLQGARGDFGATPSGIGILFKDQDTNNNTNEAEIKMMTVNATTYGDNDEAASNLIFNTTNGGTKSDKMIITGRGDVGIGTLNPGKTLDVNGSIRAASAGSSSWAEISAPRMAVDSSFYSYNTICAGNASGNCDGASGVVLKASGSNTYGNTFISGNGNSYFNTGNLGVGRTNPTYKLDVNGNARFTDTVTGVTPTAGAHLATKAYVDGAVGGGGDNLGSGGTTSGTLYASNGSSHGYIGQGGNNYARWDSSGTTYYNKAGTWRMYMHAGGFSPYTNNTMTLGGTGNRWNNLYATTGNYYTGGVNIDGEGGWAGFRMDGNAATKNLWMHYGGDTSNEVRFARTAINYGGWEANVVRLDLDAPADSLFLQGNGNVSMPQGITAGATSYFTGKLDMARNTTNQIESANNTSQLEIRQDSASGDSYLTFHNAGSYALNFGLDRSTNDLAVGGWSMGANRYRIWHEGNDGPGTGLNADLLDGLTSSAGTTADTIAVRNGAGDIYARLFRSTYGEQGAPAATADIAFRNDAGSDNYIRFMTRDGARSYLGVSDPDNLGNHVATTTLNMSNQAITSNGGTIRDANGGWVRTYGSTGWYNGTYGGGWFMQDSSWVRSYSNKNVLTAGTMQAGSFVYNSDRELKENLRPLENSGEAILGLNTYRFDWKDGKRDNDFGIIAQEVEAIYPEIVSTGGEGFKTVDYAKLVVPLLEVTKNQEARIEALEAKLEALTQ